MNSEKPLSDLIKITNKNLGFQPQTPSDFNRLILSIQKKTGQTISLSSIKRLWGYIEYSSKPSQNILNILSRFNDFDDWNDYLRRYGTLGIDESSHFLSDTTIESDNLTPGDILDVCWDKDKSCRIEYLSDHRFRILDSENIKLLPGDEFTMHSIASGLPFYASDIRRGDQTISGYIGARTSGVKSICKQQR